MRVVYYALGFPAILLMSTGLSYQAPTVASTFPRPLANDVDPRVSIDVTFDTEIDPSTIDPGSFRVFGLWSGPADGDLAIGPGARSVRFIPEEPFFSGEQVTVTLNREILGRDGTALEKGYAWSFRVRTGSGVLSQVEVARFSPRDENEQQIQIYGAHGADTDDDGWSDLAIVNERAHDVRLYRNDRRGGFVEHSRHPLAPSTFPSPSEAADLNGDRFIDLILGGVGSDRIDVLMGDGEGGFRPGVTYRAGNQNRCLAVLDLNGDGWPDVVAAGRVSSDITWLLNRGDGTLGEATRYDPGLDRETACAAADANGDGLLDLFVGSLRGRELAILLSDGEGGLRLSSQVTVEGQPWMVVAGDVDGDGNADVVSANSGGHTVAIGFGDGRGGFRRVDEIEAGLRPLAVDLGDLDGDGDLDLVSSNYDSADFTVFENDGRGGFSVAATLSASSAGSCVVLHDRDNDGDLDITGIDEVDDVILLFENRS